ncbi:hypothetical protein BZA77DRAFT_290773 [Pyronema omphalodes]|nr:hypothetical protein BZA77DRAFT_290773 [Pyronema omphalodes]
MGEGAVTSNTYALRCTSGNAESINAQRHREKQWLTLDLCSASEWGAGKEEEEGRRIAAATPNAGGVNDGVCGGAAKGVRTGGYGYYGSSVGLFLAIKTSKSSMRSLLQRYFAELLNAAARGVAGHKWNSSSLYGGKPRGGGWQPTILYFSDREEHQFQSHDAGTFHQQGSQGIKVALTLYLHLAFTVDDRYQAFKVGSASIL